MQFLSSIYLRFFYAMPAPIRVLLNIITLPFVLLYWLPRVMISGWREGMSQSFSEKDVRERLLIDAISFDDLEFENAVNKAVELSKTEDWDGLQNLVQEWERTAKASPQGNHFYRATLIGGRRSAEGGQPAPQDHGRPQPLSKLDTSGFEKLEIAQANRPHDPVLAAITARVAIEIGWTIRGSGYIQDTPQASHENMAHYFAKAQQILSPFKTEECTSPTVLAVHHMLADGLPNADSFVRDAYENWRKHAPTDLELYSDHAFKLLPRWFGTYEELEITARQAAADTQTTMGASAYAAFYMGVLVQDDGTVCSVDIEFLEEGLNDLIKFHNTNQQRVNFILATLAEASSGIVGENIQMKPYRDKIRTVFHNIVRQHLTHICLGAWDMRPIDAHMYIADAFADELAAGHTIKFTDNGVVVTPLQSPETPT